MTAIVCDVGALSRPDLAAVAGLARLQLEARRVGFELRLRAASPELRALIELVGLGEVLVVEACGDAEEREEPLGVEEEGEFGDAAF